MKFVKFVELFAQFREERRAFHSRCQAEITIIHDIFKWNWNVFYIFKIYFIIYQSCNIALYKQKHSYAINT